MIAGSAITGKVLDREYRRFVKKVEHRSGDIDLKRMDAGREAMDLERVRKFFPKSILVIPTTPLPGSPATAPSLCRCIWRLRRRIRMDSTTTAFHCRASHYSFHQYVKN